MSDECTCIWCQQDIEFVTNVEQKVNDGYLLCMAHGEPECPLCLGPEDLLVE